MRKNRKGSRLTEARFELYSLMSDGPKLDAVDALLNASICKGQVCLSLLPLASNDDFKSHADERQLKMLELHKEIEQLELEELSPWDVGWSFRVLAWEYYLVAKKMKEGMK